MNGRAFGATLLSMMTAKAGLAQNDAGKVISCDKLVAADSVKALRRACSKLYLPPDCLAADVCPG